MRCVSADGRLSMSGLVFLLILLSTGVALAEESPFVSPSSTTTENGSNYSDLSGLLDDIRKRTEGQTGEN